MIFFQIIFFLLLVIFPLGQLGRFPVGNGEIIFHLNDLIIGFFIISWFSWHVIKKQRIIDLYLKKPILFFFIISLLAFLLSLREWGFRLSGSLYLVRWIVYACLYLAIFELVREKLVKEKWISNGLLISGVIVGGLGILQYFFYPNLRNLSYLGWDSHYFRVFSTFFDPAFAGMILVLTLILMTAHFWEINKIEKKKKWLVLGGAVVVYATLALTYSRSSYLAFITGFGVIAFLKRSPKFFLGILIVSIGTLILLPKQEDRIGTNLVRQETSLARIINWQQSLQIIRDYPILGAGFNNYRQAQEKYGFLNEEDKISHAGAGADSSILFTWATTGIIGLGIYLWLGLAMGNLAWRSWKNKKSIYGLVLFSSLIALFSHSFFSNSLYYPWIMEWIWIITACVSIESFQKS